METVSTDEISNRTVATPIETPVWDTSLFDHGKNLSLKESRFIYRAWAMDRPFTWHDFKDIFLTNHAFRDCIYRLKEKAGQRVIVPRVQSGPNTFYVVKGSPIDIDSGTRYHMREELSSRKQSTLFETLVILGKQVTGVHDIDLLFPCPALYNSIHMDQGKGNKDKALPLRIISSNRSVQITAHHTGNVSVRVSCSKQPFLRDCLTELFFVLERERDRLITLYVKDTALMPALADWVVKVWHYNKDAKGLHLNGPDIEVTFSDWIDTMEKYYRKGRDWYRLERIERINKPLRKIQPELAGDKFELSDEQLERLYPFIRGEIESELGLLYICDICRERTRVRYFEKHLQESHGDIYC